MVTISVHPPDVQGQSGGWAAGGAGGGGGAEPGAGGGAGRRAGLGRGRAPGGAHQPRHRDQAAQARQAEWVQYCTVLYVQCNVCTGVVSECPVHGDRKVSTVSAVSRQGTLGVKTTFHIFFC